MLSDLSESSIVLNPCALAIVCSIVFIVVVLNVVVLWSRGVGLLYYIYLMYRVGGARKPLV